MGDIYILLEDLKKKNDSNDYNGALRQELSLPEKEVPVQIPTLCKGIYRPISPMLRTRFEFAGNWVNASFGHTWLGLKEMESPWTDEATIKHLEERKKFYDGHLLQNTDWSSISLFGVDLLQFEETLLLWSSSEEPAVYAYAGYDRYLYATLENFLRVLTERDK